MSVAVEEKPKRKRGRPPKPRVDPPPRKPDPEKIKRALAEIKAKPY